MVSLLELATVTEEGVRFLSPHDRSPMLLTPEHSISLQNSIGSDIMMQLDDVIATTSPDHARIKEAMYRSIRWLDRCIAAHKKPESQNLFCIIQGGLDLELRKECCKEMVARDTPGIAIGGLSGGEAKEEYCKVVSTCTDMLPPNKPRYVMGVGYPEDLVVSVALGADMFDCVWPTRTAVSRIDSSPSVDPANRHLPTALWQCHHLNRRPKPSARLLRRRLFRRRPRLQMHNLSPYICWRTRSHTRLHPPRCRQRDRRCTSAQYTQCALSPRPYAPCSRSHHCRPVSCLFAQLLFHFVCSGQDKVPKLGC